MKFLLVFVVVLGAVWIWRRNRAEDTRDEAVEQARQTPKPPPAVQAPAAMVACQHCGLHLPMADAVAGTQGHYCSHDHLRRHES